MGGCAQSGAGTRNALQGGALGTFVLSLFEDSSGTIWAGAESGVWRWKPGSRDAMRRRECEISDLTRTDDGRALGGMSGGGLRQLVGDRIASYPIRDATHSDRLLPDRYVDSNKLLRDRDGGLWIGTGQRGLIHVHRGRADVFDESRRAFGRHRAAASSRIVKAMIWVATTGGLDRFRKLPVTTVSAKQGLSSDAALSVLAATDGSVWVARGRWPDPVEDGQATVFRKAKRTAG